MCPRTAIYVSSYCYVCVLVLLYMCPRTAIYVSSYCYICVLLYVCPHTPIYVSSCSYICVLVLLYMCPHTAIYVSSYCSISSVLILVHMQASRRSATPSSKRRRWSYQPLTSRCANASSLTRRRRLPSKSLECKRGGCCRTKASIPANSNRRQGVARVK